MTVILFRVKLKAGDSEAVRKVPSSSKTCTSKLVRTRQGRPKTPGVCLALTVYTCHRTQRQSWSEKGAERSHASGIKIRVLAHVD